MIKNIEIINLKNIFFACVEKAFSYNKKHYFIVRHRYTVQGLADSSGKPTTAKGDEDL
jgi:hypothetical protein